DCIVDVVDTGGTLKANGLVPLEHMYDISSRMIVNKASMKTRNTTIKKMLAQIESAIIVKG
ncbi:MAG TPA: ATP phosphoribosyltransferase, partial [Thiotrichaceae bacterium]|nr:ATP phosphoribosyltransferase [Thiotrichaceae bacterium]